MKKLFLAILFFITTIMSFQQTHSMQAAAGKTAGQFAKHYAKKGFSGFMTTLHWALAGGGSFHSGITRTKSLLDEKKRLQDWDNANEQVSNFITTEMKQTFT